MAIKHIDDYTRFMTKVKVTPGGCWQWTGGAFNNGYGRFTIGSRTDNSCTSVGAHRWLYEHLYGSIDEGMHCDHLCRNRMCVNPDHIEIVTPRENILRGVGFAAKNAKSEVCSRGHLKSVYMVTKPDGRQRCSECRRIRDRKRKYDQHRKEWEREYGRSEHRKEYSRNWYHENIEKARQYQRDYRSRQKEKFT